jgi:hypothetical protein
MVTKEKDFAAEAMEAKVKIENVVEAFMFVRMMVIQEISIPLYIRPAF